MNIVELKSEWQQYNRKLELSHRLNEQLILNMLKERSASRVSKIRRDNIVLLLLMIGVLILLTAILVGNPFDFKYFFQYIPYGMLVVGVILAIVSLCKSLQQFNVQLNNANLDVFLKKTIQGYEKTKKMEGWFGVIMFSAGLLTAFSFLPNKLQNKGLWPALGETAIMIGITLFIYLVAFKLGAFKNRKKEGFENDLTELNELRAIASDLADK